MSCHEEDEVKRIELLEKRDKRYPIGLSYSELVNIVWIDPKTGKKRIFKTKKMEPINPASNQREKESLIQPSLQ
jgi:hypothetical protein